MVGGGTDDAAHAGQAIGSLDRKAIDSSDDSVLCERVAV